MAYFFRKLRKIPKHIVISRTDRIGDFVLTLPIFQALKELFDVKVTVVLNKLNAPLLYNNPFVDKVLFTDEPKESIRDSISSADVFFSLVNDPFFRENKHLFKGIKSRVGPLSRVDVLSFFNYPVLQKRSKSLKNEAEYNLELLEVFGHKVNYKIRPYLYIEEEEILAFKEKFKSKLGSYNFSKMIIVHSGMNGSALNMKDVFYFNLLDIIADMGAVSILTGSTALEKERNNLYEQKLLEKNAPFLNFTGELSLREFCVLASLVEVFIGPSTGTTHIANAVNTPLVSIYPPIQVQSKKRWEPYLAESKIFSPDVNCGQKYKCINERCPDFYCMDNISVDSVKIAINRYFNK